MHSKELKEDTHIHTKSTFWIGYDREYLGSWHTAIQLHKVTTALIVYINTWKMDAFF